MSPFDLFPADLPPFITTQRVALGLSRTDASVRQLAVTGALPQPIRFGDRGRLMFSTAAVRQAVENLLSGAGLLADVSA